MRAVGRTLQSFPRLIRTSPAMSTLAVDAARAAELVDNISDVAAKVAAAAAGRQVRLVAVSKLKPAEDVLALYTHGHRHFGENYMQELLDKAQTLPADVQWHFIGGLQTNKCAALAAVPNLYAVESVDTAKKASKLSDTRAGLKASGLGPLNVYLQVNTSGEDSKSGVAPDDVLALARHVVDQCPGLRLVGLMTIGDIARSKAADVENADFKTLVAIRDTVQTALGLDLELSMGMSSDFEEAIRQGSTNVRVGTTIFGVRPPKKTA
ncbi:uncharacterized protein V1510DRAFT_420815 [Dipodascopsis tothii]|uniref:uncharacterized protein n=1 Tax=Dipodascopsis tothii TaxID=44089 RepID=UPI0034CE662A